MVDAKNTPFDFIGLCHPYLVRKANVVRKFSPTANSGADAEMMPLTNRVSPSDSVGLHHKISGIYLVGAYAKNPIIDDASFVSMKYSHC